MKKIFLAAIFALPLLFACGKNDPEDKSSTETEIISPKFADAALDIKFSKPASLSINGKKLDLVELNFFRSGRYLITSEDVTTKSDTDDLFYFSGTFTYSNGTYKCSGDYSGSVVVSGDDVTIDGVSTEATTSHPSVTTGSMEDFIFRSWKISIIELALDSPAIKQRITCSLTKNISEAVKVANNANAGLDASVFEGFDVKEISLSPGKIMVTFTGQPTYAGSLTATAYSFSYNFTEAFTGNLVNGSASGSLKKDGDNLIATVEVKTEKLSGKIIITLGQSN